MTTRRVESRVLTAFDMFAGCGGLTQGLKQAAFNVRGAVEIDPAACGTYKLNHPEVELWPQDVKDLKTSVVMEKLSLGVGQLDLLAGCPPCQGFSSLRTHNGSKSGADKRNTLLLQFQRFVEEMLPKAIMLENVPGLEDYRLFTPFCKRLKELGYIGHHKVLDASDFSVAQRRKRLIYMAGFEQSIPFAEPSKNRITVRQTISKLLPAGKSGDPIHDIPERRTQRVKELIELIPKDGGSRSELPKEYQLPCHDKCDGFKDVYGRMAWDDVAPTITSGCFNPSKGRFLHPDKNRAISIREAAMLQGFPETYVFDASNGKVALALMIGNALPPPLIHAHARSIHQSLTAVPGCRNA